MAQANQYIPDPRQSLFLSKYLDPKSKTFTNAYQSAVEAGYEHEYAKTITAQMPTWLSESIRDSEIIQRAEKNLSEFLNDNEDKRIKADMTKFALERLNKAKYSSRAEITGKDGTALQGNTIVMADFKRDETTGK